MNIKPVMTTSVFQLPRQQQNVTSSSAVSASKTFGGDLLDISEEAQSHIGALEAGRASLEQAINESRQQSRKAAHDKVGMAHEYLRLLKSMSSPDDPAAAREAVRVAGEIRSATGLYRESLTKEDLASTGKETAGFVSEAGKGLSIARQMVESYLQHRKREDLGDRQLSDSVNAAFADLQSLVREGIWAEVEKLTTTG